MGLLQENGPCFVGNDSNSTYLNPWSWNNEVNMLYLDQPTQVGYSYDILTNGTLDIWNSSITILDPESEAPKNNVTHLVGTFSSQNLNSTSNSTEHAAHAIWHFAQTWFEEFPFYKPADEKISIWTESYGGRYGPAFLRFFQEQNEKISNGTIRGPGTHFIHLDTLGLINGCIDCDIQQLSYVDLAYNNTYGIKAINESQYNAAVESYWKEGGCKEAVSKCKELAKELDPLDRGNVDEVDRVCIDARENCRSMASPFEKYADKPRARFDIAHPAADPFPEPCMHIHSFLRRY
ncbi:serine carboxypeptidase [Phlyctema vagabunda]|uniref:Serine carboxypeptidase n=1 Tax=Phlyctema vagabunda TaxID=108571 RepID=A0ABR4PTJ7_9HELO